MILGVCCMQEPLLFFACNFDGLQFRRSARTHNATRVVMQEHLNRHLVASALLQAAVQRLDAQAAAGEVVGGAEEKPKQPKHMPLLKRGRETALEERLAKYGRVLTSGRPTAAPRVEAVPMEMHA